MALVFLEGFDKYGPPNSNTAVLSPLLTANEWTTTTGNPSIVAPLTASGQAINLNGSMAITKTLLANYPRLIGGIRFNTTLAAGGSGIEFRDGVTAQASITGNAGGTFSIRTGAVNGTIIATSTVSVSANTTHFLEWDITFSNTGSYQVWLDGASILSGTGDTTGTTNNYANTIALVCGTSTTVTFDDLYVFDNTGATNNAVILTDPRIETQFPTSDGVVQFAFGAGILGSSISKNNSTSGGSVNTLSLRRQVPISNCTLVSIGILPGTTDGTAQFIGALYADNNGAPGALIAGGPAQTGLVNGVAKNLPLTTPQSLTAGVTYWLGYLASASLSMFWEDGSNAGYRATATFASGLPATAPASGATNTWAVWGNLSASSGNWSVVRSNPSAGTLSYVFESVVGEEDLYNYPPLSGVPGAIYAVAVKGSISKSDSGARTVSLRLKSGPTDSAGTAGTIAPSTSYGWFTSYYPLDPNGNIAWTASTLNAAQAGLKIET